MRALFVSEIPRLGQVTGGEASLALSTPLLCQLERGRWSIDQWFSRHIVIGG